MNPASPDFFKLHSRQWNYLLLYLAGIGFLELADKHFYIPSITLVYIIIIFISLMSGNKQGIIASIICFIHLFYFSGKNQGFLYSDNVESLILYWGLISVYLANSKFFNESIVSKKYTHVQDMDTSPLIVQNSRLKSKVAGKPEYCLHDADERRMINHGGCRFNFINISFLFKSQPGKSIEEVFPEQMDTTLENVIRKIVASATDKRLEYFYSGLISWLELIIDPVKNKYLLVIEEDKG